MSEKIEISTESKELCVVAVGKLSEIIVNLLGNLEMKYHFDLDDIFKAVKNLDTVAQNLMTENFAQSDLIAKLEAEKAFDQKSSDEWMDAHDELSRKLKDANLENETLRRHLDVTEHGLFIPPTKSMEILRAGEIYERCERLAAEVDKYKREIGIHKFSKVWNYLTTMACKFDTDYRQWYLDAIKNLPDHLEKFRD